METVEVLRQARALLDAEGWVQCEHWTPKGRCVSGAFMAVAGTRALEADFPPRLAFCQAAEISTNVVNAWNDEVGRTKADVLAAFDKAIALAEADKP